MTDRDDIARFHIGHPAPGRRRVGAFRLVFTFSLAAVAWSIQLAAIAAIGGVCVTPDGLAVAQQPNWVDPVIMAINLGALTIALAGLLLSLLNMRQAWQAAAVPQGGVVMAGEGRAHWMAIGASFAAVLFLIAIAFNTVAVFWQGLCAL